MSLKDQRTNEEIKKEFKNHFELVNYAINTAKNHLNTDEEIPSLGSILDEVLLKVRQEDRPDSERL